MSKHIKDLEDELGVELFVRKGKRLLDCSHLFPENVTRIAIREGHLLRQFAYHFIGLCAPKVLLQLPGFDGK